MPTFKEQDREFIFPDNWKVIHYDEHPYRKKYLAEVEAVDFVAIRPDGALFLIEVKDFRGYSIQNRDKILSGSLFGSVGKKVVATVAGLLTGHFRKQIEQYEPYAALLRNANQQIRILAVIEHEYPPGDRCALFLAENDKLKPHVRWLERAHAFVLDGARLQADYGIEVKNLQRRY